MKPAARLLTLFCILPAQAQQAPLPAGWTQVAPLVGKWIADPSGPPNRTA